MYVFFFAFILAFHVLWLLEITIGLLYILQYKVQLSKCFLVDEAFLACIRTL